jgi:hypothetical protein
LRSRLFLVLLLVGVIAAFFFSVRIFGVLYAVVFPPSPPLPAGAREISHDGGSYGVGEWVYGSDDDACAVIAYYEAEGGLCVMTPGVCGESGFEYSGPGTQTAGQCSGYVDFSIFSMTWEAIISGGYDDGDQTRIQLQREVLWTGSPPEITPEP